MYKVFGQKQMSLNYLFTLIKIDMKGINAFVTFVCGVAVGAAAGLLLAPSKGEETREKIKDVLRENGIKLDSEDLNDVVDELADALDDDIEKE